MKKLHHFRMGKGLLQHYIKKKFRFSFKSYKFSDDITFATGMALFEPTMNICYIISTREIILEN